MKAALVYNLSDIVVNGHNFERTSFWTDIIINSRKAPSETFKNMGFCLFNDFAISFVGKSWNYFNNFNNKSSCLNSQISQLPLIIKLVRLCTFCLVYLNSKNQWDRVLSQYIILEDSPKFERTFVWADIQWTDHKLYLNGHYYERKRPPAS